MKARKTRKRRIFVRTIPSDEDAGQTVRDGGTCRQYRQSHDGVWDVQGVALVTQV